MKKICNLLNIFLSHPLSLSLSLSHSLSLFFSLSHPLSLFEYLILLSDFWKRWQWWCHPSRHIGANTCSDCRCVLCYLWRHTMCCVVFSCHSTCQHRNTDDVRPCCIAETSLLRKHPKLLRGVEIRPRRFVKAEGDFQKGLFLQWGSVSWLIRDLAIRVSSSSIFKLSAKSLNTGSYILHPAHFFTSPLYFLNLLISAVYFSCLISGWDEDCLWRLMANIQSVQQISQKGTCSENQIIFSINNKLVSVDSGNFTFYPIIIRFYRNIKYWQIDLLHYLFFLRNIFSSETFWKTFVWRIWK